MRAGEIKTLNKALAIKSDSLLLHLALAEKHELAGNVAAAKQVAPRARLCGRVATARERVKPPNPPTVDPASMV